MVHTFDPSESSIHVGDVGGNGSGESRGSGQIGHRHFPEQMLAVLSFCSGSTRTCSGQLQLQCASIHSIHPHAVEPFEPLSHCFRWSMCYREPGTRKLKSQSPVLCEAYKRTHITTEKGLMKGYPELLWVAVCMASGSWAL